MSQVYHGINLFWGLGGSTTTLTGVTGIFQDVDMTQDIEEVLTRDQRGNYVAATGYNPTQEATFTWYASDANAASGSAVPTAPTQYAMVTVGGGGPWSGSAWIVKQVGWTGTNTDNLKGKIKANLYPLITT